MQSKKDNKMTEISPRCLCSDRDSERRACVFSANRELHREISHRINHDGNDGRETDRQTCSLEFSYLSKLGKTKALATDLIKTLFEMSMHCRHVDAASMHH